jgi:predicted protein tyrosine phosphatase
MKDDTYWIPGPWAGRLAIVARPRGGDWLEGDVRGWREAGIDEVISLLEPDEAAELELSEERSMSEVCGLRFHAYPVADRGVPSSRESFMTLLHELHTALRKGRTVAVHCRQGIGRSALVAAGALVGAGRSPEDALRTVETARRRPVPDTEEQRNWLIQLAPTLTLADDLQHSRQGGNAERRHA